MTKATPVSLSASGEGRGEGRRAGAARVAGGEGRRAAWALVAATLFFSACSVKTVSAIRRQAAADLTCAEGQVHVSALNKRQGQYLAEACQRRAVYSYTKLNGAVRLSEIEGPSTTPPAAGGQPVVVMPPASADATNPSPPPPPPPPPTP